MLSDVLQRRRSEGLVPHELRELWAEYELPTPQACVRTLRGANSTTWIVSLPGHRHVVVRRYPPALDAEGIRCEHSILRHLARHGFPAPRVVPSRRGEGVIRVADQWFAVFDYCEGESLGRSWFLLRRLQPALLESAGTTLARLHRTLEGFLPEGARPVRNGSWFAGEVRRFQDHLCSRTRLTREDRRIGAQLAQAPGWVEAMDPLWSLPGDRVVIHGDYGPVNVLFRAGQVSAVLDFTKARLGQRLADVAQAVVLFARQPAQGLDRVTAQRFVRAYQTEYPLADAELAELPRWMAFGRLVAWWWHLTKLYDEGRREYGPKTIRTMALAQWITLHEDHLRRWFRPNGYHGCRS